VTKAWRFSQARLEPPVAGGHGLSPSTWIVPFYLHRMAWKDVDPRAVDAEMGRALWEKSEALLVRVARGP
jgi:hypothetical protein